MLSSFNPNFYIEKFVQHFEDNKIKMSRHYKKQTPTRQPATPKFPDIEEEEDANCDDESVAIIRIITMLMFLLLILIAILHSNKQPLLVWLSLS
jgi:hypothetical protein